MSDEPEWRVCPIVGGENDGDRVRCDVRRPQVTMRKREPMPPWVQVAAMLDAAPIPVDMQMHTYQRLELQAGDGGPYRGPDHSTFLYHDPSLKPWEVLRLLVERYSPQK